MLLPWRWATSPASSLSHSFLPSRRRVASFACDVASISEGILPGAHTSRTHYRRAESLLRRKNRYMTNSSVDTSTPAHNGNNNGRRPSRSSSKSDRSVTVRFDVLCTSITHFYFCSHLMKASRQSLLASRLMVNDFNLCVD